MWQFKFKNKKISSNEELLRIIFAPSRLGAREKKKKNSKKAVLKALVFRKTLINKFALGIPPGNV